MFDIKMSMDGWHMFQLVFTRNALQCKHTVFTTMNGWGSDVEGNEENSADEQ